MPQICSLSLEKVSTTLKCGNLYSYLQTLMAKRDIFNKTQGTTGASWHQESIETKKRTLSSSPTTSKDIVPVYRQYLLLKIMIVGSVLIPSHFLPSLPSCFFYASHQTLGTRSCWRQSKKKLMLSVCRNSSPFESYLFWSRS